ncbi:MAG: L-threonylcarbamoyladenylate synthase, partial [Cyanobacteria bacterium P01_A01_bin.135]
MQVDRSILIERLRVGGCLASFPTDTVPALASRPQDAELIYKAKRRSPQKSLILMAADAEDIWPFVTGSAAERREWQRLAQVYWPGMVTFVLPARDGVPRVMHAGTPETLGFRVPDCAIAQDILAQTGPLATTSVNLSGTPPLTSLAEINRAFPEVLTLREDNLADNGGSYAGGGKPSTVVEWASGEWR